MIILLDLEELLCMYVYLDIDMLVVILIEDVVKMVDGVE